MTIETIMNPVAAMLLLHLLKLVALESSQRHPESTRTDGAWRVAHGAASNVPRRGGRLMRRGQGQHHCDVETTPQQGLRWEQPHLGQGDGEQLTVAVVFDKCEWEVMSRSGKQDDDGAFRIHSDSEIHQRKNIIWL